MVIRPNTTCGAWPISPDRTESASRSTIFGGRSSCPGRSSRRSVDAGETVARARHGDPGGHANTRYSRSAVPGDVQGVARASAAAALALPLAARAGASGHAPGRAADGHASLAAQGRDRPRHPAEERAGAAYRPLVRSHRARSDAAPLRRLRSQPVHRARYGPVDLLLHANDGLDRRAFQLRPAPEAFRAHAAPVAAVP